LVGSISRLVNDLIFINELITKHGGSWSEHGGMQSEGSFHIILKNLYTLDEYFVIPII
jgi:hypothetical protein